MRYLTTLASAAIALLAMLSQEEATSQPFQLLTAWPQANGIVHAMALDQATGVLYLGGEFTVVDGQARQRLAAIDTQNGTLLPWAPTSDGIVRALAVRGDSVIVGGSFADLSGSPRTGLGSMDKASGALLSWAPVLNEQVFCLLGDGSTLYVGGAFTSVDAQVRHRLVSFDATGSVTPWDPDAQAAVNAMTWNAGNILLAGGFLSVGGASRVNFAEVDANTGIATGWVANTNGVGVGLLSAGGRVFLGGLFSSVNGTPRSGVAEVDATTGAVEPWSATLVGHARSLALVDNTVVVGGFFSTVNGTAHPNLAMLDGSNGALLASSPDAGSLVNTVIADVSKLYIGGAFNTISSTQRSAFAAFSTCTPTTWFVDSDGDGFGSAAFSVSACSAPPGFAATPNDCNDADAGIGAPQTWYVDADGDEYGDPLQPVVACVQPPGTSEDPTDCDDTDPDILPGTLCDDNDPYTAGDLLREYPECACRGKQIVISVKVFLEGPYDPNTGLMRDDLRAAGLIPLMEPYTGLGYDFQSLPVSHGDVADPSVFNVTGPNAIVDWVLVEYRQSFNTGTPVAARCALLQRDGDVVEPDGVSPLRFPLAPTNYHFAILHRNHMGVSELSVGGNYYEITEVDLTHPGFPLYGAAPVAVNAGVVLLRAGDVTFDDDVRYVGQGNDRDLILTRIGGSVPTAITSGYYQEDVNMDGIVKYVGANNDRDLILITIGGTIPTVVRPNVYHQ